MIFPWAELDLGIMNSITSLNRRRFMELGALAGAAAILPGRLDGKTMIGGEDALLPSLDYAYDALAPHIDAQTMEIHHSKHHAGYVKKFNAALDSNAALRATPINDLMASLSGVEDVSLRAALRNNGGGHWNHSLFWKSMAPVGKGGKLSDELGLALQSGFGSVADFKAAFAKAAATRFGSGWAWLIVQDGKLKVTSTPNQDNPLMKGLVDEIGTPILGIDVWEHAYYLHYQNRRGDYIDAWWKVVNWQEVSKRFKLAIS